MLLLGAPYEDAGHGPEVACERIDRKLRQLLR